MKSMNDLMIEQLKKENTIFNMFMKKLAEDKEAAITGDDGVVTVSISNVGIEHEHLMNEAITVLSKRYPKEIQALYHNDKKKDKEILNTYKALLKELTVVTLDFENKHGDTAHDEVVIFSEELDGKVYNNFFKDKVVYLGKNEPKV